MRNYTKNITGTALAYAFIGIPLFFMALGAINGASRENRAIQIEERIKRLGDEYRALASQAEEQRVFCARTREMEAQMAALNRQANSLRAELQTYVPKAAAAK